MSRLDGKEVDEGTEHKHTQKMQLDIFLLKCCLRFTCLCFIKEYKELILS